MQSALDFCLRGQLDFPKIADLSQWRSQWERETRRFSFPGDSVAAAIQVGFHANSVAWAFLSGYQAAIRKMLSSTDIDLAISERAIIGFSVSEKMGNHPRDISTRFRFASDEQLILDGAKSWVIAGDACDWMIVSGVNQSSDNDGSDADASSPPAKLDIRLLTVAATDAGVSFVQNPPTKFIPEVVHGGAVFNQVELPSNRLLPGDGHQRYVKPFRTLEDIHIGAAVLAYLVRCGREFDWPRSVTENNLALIGSMQALSSLDPSQPATHLALTGILTQLQHSYDAVDTCWANSANAVEAATRWNRDRALFDIAKKTRQTRADRAWGALSSG
jgi:hypothetical protein